MSKMSNQAALTCTQCGRPMLLTMLETTSPDPDSEMLIALMRTIAQAGMCPACRKKLNHEVAQGGKSDYRLRPVINLIQIPKGKK